MIKLDSEGESMSRWFDVRWVDFCKSKPLAYFIDGVVSATCQMFMILACTALRCTCY